MPKLIPSYPKMDDVPEALRPFYREQNGRAEVWIEADATDVLAPIITPGLSANRDAIKTEKQTEKTLKEQAQAQVATLTQQLNDAQTKLNTGKTVSSEDFTLLEEIKKHGELPQVKEKLEKFPQLEATVQKTEREKLLSEVRKAAGFTNEKIFNDLANHPEYARGFNYTVETVKEGENDVKKAYVSFKNAAGVDEKHEVRTFAESNENWKPYLSLLTANPDGGQSDTFGTFGADTSGQQTGQQTGQTGGISFVPSTTTANNTKTKEQSGNLVDSFIDTANKKRAEAPNPFAPQKAA